MRRKRRIFGVAIALAVAAWFWRLAPDPLFAEPESSVLLAPVLAQRARDRDGIDARVLFKTPVLKFDQRLPVFQRHRSGSGKAPLTIAGDARA